jgi:hypothetical protein
MNITLTKTQGKWGGLDESNGSGNKLAVKSTLAKLKDLLSARPIQTIDMSNVTSVESDEAAIGQVPFEPGRKSAPQRIAWVFGCVAWWLISQYGTVYDPRYDDDTNQEPLTSFRDAGNDERFVGDKDLPAGFPRPARIQGMVAEDIYRAWHLLVQMRKFTKPGKSLITRVQAGTNMCFQPVYLHGEEFIPPPVEIAGPAIESVTFMLAGDEEDQFFELAKSAILEDNGHTQELYDFLHSLLEWPKGYVNITGVTMDNPDSKHDTPVNTLDELRDHINHEHSVFQLHVAGSGQVVDTVPAPHQDYRTHSILKLEDLVSELSDDGNAEAQLLFGLIRRNRRLSKDCARDLMVLFKPLRDQTDQKWAEDEGLMTLCEKGVNMDAGTALGFRAWINHLSNQTKQKHAKIYLELIETESPLKAHGIEELVKLFTSDNGSWAELRDIKDIFDQVHLDADSV